MARLPYFRGRVTALGYAGFAPALLLSQHLAVALAFRSAGSPLSNDAGFWWLPLRRLTELPELTAPSAALAFAWSLAVAWALALLSFRRAFRFDVGCLFAALAIIPAVQLAAVAFLMVTPVSSQEPDPPSEKAAKILQLVQGVLAGVAIIVVAVLVSALTFGAYGWGLFVMTPFMVGVTTGYIVNSDTVLAPGRTELLVLAAAALGSLALIMLALEGLVCIILAAPLGAIFALGGGALGRAMVTARQRRGKPLGSIALLPAIFAAEAAMPPAAPIAVHRTIDIASPPPAVWRALTSNDPIRLSPGLVASAGLAYPIGNRLMGEGVGATRLGEFSTGVARERITAWVPGAKLAFVVLSQPPAMEEMSPYRRVHAPHVSGYFETGTTSFELQPLPGGATRLSLQADHVLRIDPVPYWEPLARWAVGRNASRVLEDIRRKAEEAEAP
jgi:hypothetical protein